MKIRARVAWGSAAVAVVLLIGLSVISWFAFVGDERANGYFALAWVAYPVVGAVIASRRPRHPVGWILIGVGTALAVGITTSAYAEYAIVYHHRLPAPTVAALVGQVFIYVGLALLPFLVLLFPTGTVESARWRVIGRLGAVLAGLVVISYVFRDKVEIGSGVRIRNPLALGPAGTLFGALVPVLVPATVVFALAVVGHAVWRFIRSRGDEHEQLKWFAFSVVLFPLLFGLGLVLPRPISDVVFVMAMALGLNGVAAAVGVAVLRYRLYEIDSIISRTLSYALITLLLAGTFALIVVIPTTLIGSRTRTPSWLVAGATLIAAALSRPVQRRVQGAVDHRFNRARYDAERTVAAFATRLRDEIDIDTLKVDLETLVRNTMAPAYVSVWMRQDAT